jgi:hypothetical protein
LLGGDGDALRRGLHGDRVYPLGGFRAGGADLDRVTGEVAQEARGHLRAAGVMASMIIPDGD